MTSGTPCLAMPAFSAAMSGRFGTEKLLMIEREVGDAGDERAFDHVGRIQPAAQTDFQDAGVGGRTRKGEECRGRCRDLEEAWLDARAGVEHFT